MSGYRQTGELLDPEVAATGWPTARRHGRARLRASASMVLVAAAAVVLGACGGKTSSAPTSAGAQPSAPPAAGPPAPAFTLTDIDGRRFSLSEHRGSVVVLDFLAAGCPTCAQQVPILDEVASRFAGRGVTVLIVDLSGLDDRELGDYYRGQYGAGEKVLIAADRGFRVARAFQLAEMTAFVIGPRGEIAWQGTPTLDVLDRVIRKLIRKSL